VDYLQSLGRAREVAGPEGEARARDGCNCPNDAMAQMAFNAAALNASAARPRRGADAPGLIRDGDEARGQILYAANCASCHGARGNGDGPGALSLRPRPADLSAHEYTLDRLSDALWNGVAGTAMQAWRDHPLEDLSAMARAVKNLQAPQEAAVPETFVVLGQRVYAANCVQCHGVNGRGDGSAAAELSTAPTDFTRQRPTLGHSITVMRNGMEGTRMASWTGRISEAELVAVANYVRTFFEPDDAPAGGRAR
jgi:cbb3-type cytochrome c oxidase subunit III